MCWPGRASLPARPTATRTGWELVALALPDLYSEFEASIPAVSWVLTVYALTAAIASLAGLRLLRRAPGPAVAAAGSAVFATASVAAGLAPSLSTLIVARGIQGIGAAALIGGAYSLLVGLAGEQRRAVTWWAAAGTAGAVLGPALGGFVTQAKALAHDDLSLVDDGHAETLGMGGAAQ